MAENKDDIYKNIIGIPRDTYGDKHSEHVLEIYKLYVEMADRISARRQTANSFFLTINSAIVALVGYVNLSTGYDNVAFLFYTMVAVAGMVLSYLWYRLVLSYKQLNSGKFNVIHAIESMLPLRAYDAEWIALGSGKNPKIYKPFTDIETAVPWVFFSIHAIVLLVSLYFVHISPA